MADVSEEMRELRTRLIAAQKAITVHESTIAAQTKIINDLLKRVKMLEEHIHKDQEWLRQAGYPKE